MNRTIKFSHNWNNKLLCISLTTIRPRCDEKYIVGHQYNIEYNDNLLGTATILSISHFRLEHLNEVMSRLDTGYSKEAATNIIKTMYKARNYNYEFQEFSFILLHMTDTKQRRYIIPTPVKLTDKNADLHPAKETAFAHMPENYVLALA